MKYCALCGCQRDRIGGGIMFVLGSRRWVCSRHK